MFDMDSYLLKYRLGINPEEYKSLEVKYNDQFLQKMRSKTHFDKDKQNNKVWLDDLKKKMNSQTIVQEYASSVDVDALSQLIVERRILRDILHKQQDEETFIRTLNDNNISVDELI